MIVSNKHPTSKIKLLSSNILLLQVVMQLPTMIAQFFSAPTGNILRARRTETKWPIFQGIFIFCV